MSSDKSAIGKKSCSKGKAGEREFIRRVATLTDGQIRLKRNLNQCRDRGDDTGIDRFSIEIKRWKNVSDALIRDWWHKCERTANEQEKMPVLAYRADKQGWQIMMHPGVFFPESDVRAVSAWILNCFASGCCTRFPFNFRTSKCADDPMLLRRCWKSGLAGG